mmetsp:Transcript_6497/g.13566  ORF Transcript_6497/g.13566 Transcript_6497/m.13566 type:complete len:135 (+) Transcript_6497:1572-1976(+)
MQRPLFVFILMKTLKVSEGWVSCCDCESDVLGMKYKYLRPKTHSEFGIDNNAPGFSDTLAAAYPRAATAAPRARVISHDGIKPVKNLRTMNGFTQEGNELLRAIMKPGRNMRGITLDRKNICRAWLYSLNPRSP